MINRLKQFEEPDEEVPGGDFWEVWCEIGSYYVSAETAGEILRALDRVRPPRWLRFTDLFGSLVNLRSRDIQRVTESTLEQRAAGRRFRRARRDERKADRRPWDDDDDWW